MGRLQIVKHFSFAFLGDAWKEGYMNFSTFTAKDVSDNISTTIDQDKPDPKAVKESYDGMIVKLEAHFIDGKFPTDDGKLEDIQKGELGALPVDIIQEAIAFLSQSQAPTLPTPSENS